MKNKWIICLAALAAISCAKPESEDGPSGSVSISAILSDAITKVAFTPGEKDGKPYMSLAWAEGDMLRVYDHEDHSQFSDFVLDASCIGKKQGRFSGPQITAASYDVAVLNASVNYSGQTQPKDGDAGDGITDGGT